MKVQEILENYNSLKASITIVEVEIQELENDYLETKSTNFEDMPKTKNFTSSNVENFVTEKEDT